MWELTRACKLSCLHCPAGAQQKRSQAELSTYEAYKTIDQIAALAPEELIMTGGDPLERGDLLQLIDYAQRRRIRPSLSVTATAGLTGSMIGKLRANGLGSMAISVDSAARDRFDRGRRVPGLFTSTLMAIRWVRTAALPLEINTLVTRDNVEELDTIASLVGDLDARRWNVYFPVPIGPSKQLPALTAGEAENAFGRLAEISERGRFIVRAFEAPQYGRYLTQKAIREDPARPGDGLTALAACAAPLDRRDILFISHTGEVSISPFLPLGAGNVRYQPLPALYRSDILAALRDDDNLRGTCGRCEFKRICGGSRARAFAISGDPFATDPLCAYLPAELAGAQRPVEALS
jgi:MoaA/NifB/PqqE/SkfB family radical SAM enzyme